MDPEEPSNILSFGPKLVPPPEPEPDKLTCDDVLAANLGRLSEMVLVGVDHEGHLVVAGTGNVADAFLMLNHGSNCILNSEYENGE